MDGAQACVQAILWSTIEMTKQPGKDEPDTPGGRAAERLRQFEESRKPTKPEGEPAGDDEQKESNESDP
jgi:hypothetical protein